jgi:hypothetical protein
MERLGEDSEPYLSGDAMAQQLESAPAQSPVEQNEPNPLANAADVPASPAALWASESRANYSITHTEKVEHDWIDCGCVIHSE